MTAKLPGMPERSDDAIHQREAITAAIVALHRAMRPLCEVLDSNASLSMKFKVAGDTLKVSIAPGKPNDDGGLR